MSYEFLLNAECDKCEGKYELSDLAEFICQSCQTGMISEKELKDNIIEIMKEICEVNDEWKTPEIIISQVEFDKIEKDNNIGGYYIISEYTSESEKKMYMLGMKYGIRNALHTIASNFDAHDEWDDIVNKYL